MKAGKSSRWVALSVKNRSIDVPVSFSSYLSLFNCSLLSSSWHILYIIYIYLSKSTLLYLSYYIYHSIFLIPCLTSPLVHCNTFLSYFYLHFFTYFSVHFCLSFPLAQTLVSCTFVLNYNSITLCLFLDLSSSLPFHAILACSSLFLLSFNSCSA